MTNRMLEYIEGLGRTPVIPLLGFPALGFRGNTILESVTDPDVQYMAIEESARNFSLDVLITVMDLTIEAETLGAGIRFPENESPSVKDHPLQGLEQLERLRIPDPGTDGRMHVFVKTVKKMKKNLSLPVMAYVIGPYTLAGEMMKVENTLRASIRNPEYLREILSFMTRAIIPYARALVSAGADILTILEPTASMLSPVQFRDFSGRYVSEIFDSVQACMTVLHICGNTKYILEEMAATGADGLSLDSAVKFDEVIDLVPESVLIGNIDPVRVMLRSSPEKVRERTMELRTLMKGRRNFILGTGCDLPPGTPHENIHAFIEAGKARI